MVKKKSSTGMFLLAIMLSLIVFVILIFVTFSIFIPAYFSTVIGCEINAEIVALQEQSFIDGEDINASITLQRAQEIAKSKGVVLQGVTDNTGQILLFTNNEKVLKHELCHRRQVLEGRSASCGESFLSFAQVYSKEFECYVIDRF